ncbi:MAG: carboxypeptidase-like regulatory domain-containing protein [Prevotellaceae bacterium]|jgi:PBP1b-binding outer membrane lipoprotein LpoB|nr:carboxypeptidase-like regulatory domain-containing protein [Prevotellaceae bacterium]
MKKIILLLSCVLLAVIFNGCSKNQPDMYATLYGVITDHSTGEPIANASVVLSPGGKTKTTGNDGAFEFPDLNPAQYTITVQKTGYQTNRKTVTAVTGEKTEANIPLTKSE